ncbi:helix-turn-helix transcriptional regulator [Candidatus Peregrinibacteria bacterium]|nr:helix-turn-helix transcriptional regulator [Candidatus Peregrinibacteria bacterium]
MGTSKNSEIVLLLKSLANDIRVDILRYLASGEKCVCHIFEHLGLPQNLVSHHLSLLRKSGFIRARKDGKWVHYSLNPKEFRKLKAFFDTFVSKKVMESCCVREKK